MGALYVLSDGLKFLLYRVFCFRKAIVRKNLENSFPEKDAAWLDKTESLFYSHMCDLIVESIKFFSISQEEALARMTYKNPEIFAELYQNGKSVVLVGGHFGNWELLALTVPQNILHKPYALYTPMSNKFFNEKMKSSRSRYGLGMMPINEVRAMFDLSKEIPIAAIFGSDQSPRNPKKAYWTTFLNQDTGVQFGAEKFAKDYGCAAVYGVIHKLGRGKYQTEFKLICEDASQTPYGYITETHTQWLEEKIRQDPPNWLWSHRRWKHKRPENLEAADL